MANYIVDFTDIRTTPISVAEGDVNNTSTDATLFGRIRLEYGEVLNENLLHLLEHFGCAEDPITPGTPLLDRSHENLLSTPVNGQFWFNSTTQVLYEWDGAWNKWIPLRGIDDVAANWGSIGHGQQLPRPVSQSSGYEFEYEECIWSVAPSVYEGGFSSMSCGTDPQSIVTMEYKTRGSSETLPGTVNYLIIGIKGNNNLGVPIQPPPLPGDSPTPTPEVTPTPSSTPGAIPPTPTVSPTNSLIPDECGSARFRDGVPYYYRSSQGLIDVDYNKITMVWSYYGDSYAPSRYNEGDLCDTDRWSFAMGYYSNSGGWNIKQRRHASDGGGNFSLNYTTVPGLVTTGRWHAMMFAMDTQIGIAKLYVDGQVAQIWQSGVSGFDMEAHTQYGASNAYWGIDDQLLHSNNGRVAHVWCHNQYFDPAIYYNSFFDEYDLPRDIGLDGTGAVGVQPKTYFKTGHAHTNGGTLDDWTEIGSVECAEAPFSDTAPTPTPTATVTPTPALPLTAKLYMSPAVCDPGTPGPGGTTTYHHPTCGTVSKSAYDQSTYVSLQALTGGVPPYFVEVVVDYTIVLPNANASGLVAANPHDPNYNQDEFIHGYSHPISEVLRTYFGGTPAGGGALANQRIGVLPGEIVYARMNFNSAEFYSGYDYEIENRFSGYIRVTDSVGTTKRWWIPTNDTAFYPGYTHGCPIGGTNHTDSTPIPGSPGATAWWIVNWAHHGIPEQPAGIPMDYASACNDCADCIN